MEMRRVSNPWLNSRGRFKREIVNYSIITGCDDNRVVNMNGCDKCVCDLVISLGYSFHIS